MLDKRPAPVALEEERRFQQTLLAARGGGGPWPPLPATAWEVASLAKRFKADRRPVKTLLGREASEQALYDLAVSDKLSEFGFIHLATHGRIDVEHPRRSAVIVSEVNLPDPLEQVTNHLPPFDGRLSVEEIVSNWKLNADLVTPSACETALGKRAGGEGMVGFTQALLMVGADALCLSLWPVDDVATALIMDRFYANLLGQREGLEAPLSKVAALAEAQAWLRELTSEEATARTAQLTNGVPRGAGRQGKIVDAPKPPKTAPRSRPFAHPYYWSAFVLVGKRE
ncbi:MAG TPA: CHAT domain-containing protein [Pirellulales bacterium]|nr:CHAT domain-containing protein [Pirellulales bacterium]